MESRFIWDEVPAEELFDGWLNELQRIEDNSRSFSHDDERAAHLARNLGLFLFPIIESISENLFEEGGRRYLRELGYSERNANLMILIFRNGLAHNARGYRLRYDDREIGWAVISNAGSGPIRPFMPWADEPFVVRWDESGGQVTLHVARLLAHVRLDLETRRQSDLGGLVRMIVGRRLSGVAPVSP
jgi:hypothetical protein